MDVTQALIQKKCNQTVCVHCCAHQLNLVLVDVVKQIPAASSFFALIEALYVFLSSCKSHETFISIQMSRGGREVRLGKLSDTQWSCRHESIVAISATYPAVVETLQTIMNGPDRNRQIEASGILSGITDYKFIICLIIYKVFSITACLADLLQTESVDLGNADTVI